MKVGAYLAKPVAEYTLTAAAAAVIDPLAAASQSGWLFERPRADPNDSWRIGSSTFRSMMDAATLAAAKHAGLDVSACRIGANGFRKMMAQRAWSQIAGEPDAKKRKVNALRYKQDAQSGVENLVVTYAAAAGESPPGSEGAATAAAPADSAEAEEDAAFLRAAEQMEHDNGV